jgi:beta-RFAP synthase
MTDSSVSVTVPARLHLGFLDLDGGLGRRFGSLGMALDGPSTRLILGPGRGLSARGPDGERAVEHLRRVTRHFGLGADLHLEIVEAIPAHAGLGSGTQLALATGAAVCRYHRHEARPRELARLLDRGARSGVGLGAFEQGGVLLDGGKGDGGKGDDDGPPPIVSRLAFPAPWRVLLILDRRRGGVHGSDETAAFQNLAGFPGARAGHLCRLVLMQALPALAERDLGRFGAAVTEIQETIGDHFAPAQGGRYSSPAVAEVLTWLGREGVAGLGQSSWGPTGFALIGSEQEARDLRDEARRCWPEESGLWFQVRRGRNEPARVETGVLAGAELQS